MKYKLNYFFFNNKNTFEINKYYVNQLIPPIPIGELYFGTIGSKLCGSPPNQGFYKLTPDGTVTKMLSNLVTSNGVTFDPRTSTIFHLDGCAQRLMSYKVKKGQFCKEIESKN